MQQQISRIKSEEDLVHFLNDFEANLRDHQEKISRLQFKKMVEKCQVPNLVELENEVSLQINNPRFGELVSTWQEKVADSTMQRRLAVWNKAVIQHSVKRHPEVRALTRELGDAMITHEYQIAGMRSDLGQIKNILRTSPDTKLREDAWRGKIALSKTLAPKLLQLINLRNHLAKDLGYTNYAEFTLQLEGLSLAQVKNMLTELTQASNPIYQKILIEGQEKLNLSQIDPWDLMYLLESMGAVDPQLFPKEKIIPALKEWSQIHHADLAELGIEVVFTDIPYNGLCCQIKPGDIRILANPADGHTYFRTLFHELGHALHGAYNAQKYFIFRRDSGILGEGMAELIAYITRKPRWLESMGFDQTDSLQIQKRLIAPWFHYLRERTANALAEYQIYENTTENPDQILATTERDILGVAFNLTPRWAADSWYINFPVYWQNYVLADLIASQIHQILDARYGGLDGHPEALAEIRQIYYAPGASIDWQEKIIQHTSTELRADALVEDLHLYLT